MTGAVTREVSPLRSGVADRRADQGDAAMRLSHLPLRVTTGAFILNSGLSKRGLEGQAAEGLHGMAAGAIPPVARMQPTTFGQALSTAEIALGVGLLLPFVSPVVVGAGLTAFGAGLVQLYLKTPGMREPGSLKPTQDGIGLAKDVWLVGAGLALLGDGLLDGAKDAAKSAGKSVQAAVPGR
jgi:hypothetical protein